MNDLTSDAQQFVDQLAEPIARPNASTLCSECHHKLAVHFVTFDGTRGGCRYESSDQRDTGWVCRCQGFSIRLGMFGSHK